jgi:hypothetical protein
VDQLVVFAVVVGRDGMEDAIGQVDRLGRRLAGDCAEVAAGLAKDVTDIAVAVVDAVQDRLRPVP